LRADILATLTSGFGALAVPLSLMGLYGMTPADPTTIAGTTLVLTLSHRTPAPRFPSTLLDSLGEASVHS
jgi:hypothetical protein